MDNIFIDTNNEYIDRHGMPEEFRFIPGDIALYLTITGCRSELDFIKSTRLISLPVRLFEGLVDGDVFNLSTHTSDTKCILRQIPSDHGDLFEDVYDKILLCHCK